jgi:glycerol kinase
MSTNRSLAAAAASTLLAAALLLGAGLPAQAAPLPSPTPTPTPFVPGPGSPRPTPVGPLFTIPSCANMVTAAITATRFRYPAFGSVANVPGLLGAQNATLVAVINAHPGARTCSYGTGTAQVIVTETAITPAEYKILLTWYLRNSTSARAGGGPTWGGGTRDTHFFVGSVATPDGPSHSEVASISPNGWWITVRDAAGLGVQPYFEMDAVAQFFALNPRLALVTR